MENYFRWSYEAETECSNLIFRLQTAKDKISPIVDDIVLSAVNLIEKGDNNFISEWKLTLDEYRDVIWASQILKEIKYKNYYLPNSNIIVNHVSVENTKQTCDKCVVIDEATVIELLELYDRLGDVLHIMLSREQKSRRDTAVSPKSSQKSNSQSKSDCKYESTLPASTTTSEYKYNKADELTSEVSLKPCIKSTCAAYAKSKNLKNCRHFSHKQRI